MTLSSFTFQRQQCLQPFMLSKGDDAFIYISKTTMSSVIYAFKRWRCLHLHFEDDNVFSHLCFQKATMPSFTFQKTTMSSVIYAFKRRQCLHLHFEDDNVFSHLCFQKATMPSFTFQRQQCLQPYMLSKMIMSSSQRLQCLQSFMLSIGDNAFIYISNTTMSSVIYAFKRQQCLHLHFKDNTVFSHICFQRW